MPQLFFTIIIADDHPIFREGLRKILEDEPDFRVVGEFDDGESALQAIRIEQPHIAILDIEMPGMTGLDVAAVLQRDRIPTAVVILTISNRVEIFNRAMDYGVVGYILKDTAVDDVVRGLRTVLGGEYFLSSSLLTRSVTGRVRHEAGADAPRGLSDLTPTERIVLGFIAENKTSDDIAHLLSIGIRTVESHRSNILSKLGLHGSYTLVRFALQHKHLL